jgi:hypothetical protein
MGLDQILRHYLTLWSRDLGIKDIYPLFNAFVMAILVILLAVVISQALNRFAPVLIGNKRNYKFSNYYQLLKSQITIITKK